MKPIGMMIGTTSEAKIMQRPGTRPYLSFTVSSDDEGKEVKLFCSLFRPTVDQILADIPDGTLVTVVGDLSNFNGTSKSTGKPFGLLKCYVRTLDIITSPFSRPGPAATPRSTGAPTPPRQQAAAPAASADDDSVPF